MSVTTRVARVLAVASLLAVAVVVSTPVQAQLDFKRVLCATGTSTGDGWSWRITDTTGSVPVCEDLDVPGEPMNASTLALIQKFVNSINGNCPPGAARAELLQPATVTKNCGSNFDAGFELKTSQQSNLHVGDISQDPQTGTGACEVPEAPAFCNFNPEISLRSQQQAAAVSMPGLSEGGRLLLVALILVAASVLILGRIFRAA